MGMVYNFALAGGSSKDTKEVNHTSEVQVQILIVIFCCSLIHIAAQTSTTLTLDTYTLIISPLILSLSHKDHESLDSLLSQYSLSCLSSLPTSLSSLSKLLNEAQKL